MRKRWSGLTASANAFNAPAEGLGPSAIRKLIHTSLSWIPKGMKSRCSLPSMVLSESLLTYGGGVERARDEDEDGDRDEREDEV